MCQRKKKLNSSDNKFFVIYALKQTVINLCYYHYIRTYLKSKVGD